MDSQREAFIGIVEDYKKMIYKIAHSYTKRQEDCEDLMQEIVLQLWRAYPNYDNTFKLSTWIYRIALNVSISFYRKEKTRKNINTNVVPSFISISSDFYDEEKDEKIRQLYQFIHQLKELDKALMLLYLEQHSYEEIADILGITKTNVSTKINRIKSRLKTYFFNQKNN
ncbi:MAG: RNA polymerase sigma factor (sigma-70 family) [Maribacter sp.]|jgi:RNA polymerase sigma factor (sigma-70 family)